MAPGHCARRSHRQRTQHAGAGAARTDRSDGAHETGFLAAGAGGISRGAHEDRRDSGKPAGLKEYLLLRNAAKRRAGLSLRYRL
jgi:hypothetical protein